MGSLRLTLCAGAVVAAALTPAAYAADPGGVSVNPSSPAPGADVQVLARGCEGKRGTAASDAFVVDAQLVGKDGALAGETRVRSSLAPGTYDVKVSCDGYDDKLKGSFTVAGRSSATPTAPASPVAPVPAGGGGTAHLAAVDARSTGPGTRHAVIGLVLASVAAVAVAVRSARRGRGSE